MSSYLHTHLNRVLSVQHYLNLYFDYVRLCNIDYLGEIDASLYVSVIEF